MRRRAWYENSCRTSAAAPRAKQRRVTVGGMGNKGKGLWQILAAPNARMPRGVAMGLEMLRHARCAGCRRTREAVDELEGRSIFPPAHAVQPHQPAQREAGADAGEATQGQD